MAVLALPARWQFAPAFTEPSVRVRRNAIALEALWHFTALDDFSFGVRAGEVVGLLGPNGAGKTTLLRLLMGYLRPTSGTAAIDGLDCYRQSFEVHRRVSYLPGEARLFRTMRGRDVIDFFTAVRRDGSRARAVALAGDRFGLDLSRPVSTMSTGMRQKLALAVTLAVDTPLVILDEPTSNLDPTVRADVAALVVEAKQAGRTVIFSSHVISEVEQVCDRAVILRQGRAGAHAGDRRPAAQASHPRAIDRPACRRCRRASTAR